MKRQPAQSQCPSNSPQTKPNHLPKKPATKQNNSHTVTKQTNTKTTKTKKGVHGRVSELGRITQRRFQLAMAIALGRSLDAVVVDTKATGYKCIDYLKERR